MKKKKPMNVLKTLVALLFVLVVGCSEHVNIIAEVDYDSLEFNDFVEKDFPFINTSLDLRTIGKGFPSDNYASRVVAVQLGNEAYMAFDPDLLRWSVAWKGDFVSMSGVAQVSYKDFFNKDDGFPKVLGEPIVATGIYPGWTNYFPDFKDVRARITEADSLVWGPLPSEHGRWEGVYTFNQQAVLNYAVAGVSISDFPSSQVIDEELVLTRAIRIEPFKDTLYTVLAEVNEGEFLKTSDNMIAIKRVDEGEEVAVVGLSSGSAAGERLFVQDDRYVVMAVAPQEKKTERAIFMWSGRADQMSKVQGLADRIKTNFPKFEKGGKPYWTDKVYTKGKRAADSSAYVLDQITLPLPNPWKRNVRAADMAFFEDGRAALLTFEGDVWIVSNINDELNKVEWKRYASGLYEPMSLKIHKEQVFVFGREGVIRLHDLNKDGNVDFYENFASDVVQSMDSREWAADMAIDEDGSIYLAKGGGTIPPSFTSIAPKTPKGYRASSVHAGVILKISPDGKQTELYATGLRVPYIGFDLEDKFMTVSDQQGNFVPATPIYQVQQDDYFGVPPAGHGKVEQPAKNPLLWIPHRIDRSSISQLWLRTDKMGPLSQSMVHFSFGRPGVFSVLVDKASKEAQAAVSYLSADYPTPVLKGAISPKDGQMYLAGFNLWGSNSQGISSLTRLRYTGKPYFQPTGFQAGQQGLVLNFSEEIDPKVALDVKNFKVKRWNYERTSKYGSGHFLLNGEPGEEVLPVLKILISKDQKSLLLVLPNMTEVMQMELLYSLKSQSGQSFDNEIYFTINDANPMNLSKSGFADVDLTGIDLNLTDEELIALQTGEGEVSKKLGAVLFDKFACKGCHSTGTSTDGMYGPPLEKIFGSTRTFIDGTSVTVTDAYLEEAIMDPKVKIVKGYGEEMPSYSGILSKSEVKSLVLFLKSL